MLTAGLMRVGWAKDDIGPSNTIGDNTDAYVFDGYIVSTLPDRMYISSGKVKYFILAIDHLLAYINSFCQVGHIYTVSTDILCWAMVGG